MTTREQTQQQLDPAASFELRRAILLVLAILPALMLTLAVVRFLNSSSPATALVAIGLVAAACSILAVAISPARAPVPRSVHVVVLGLSIGAMLVDVAAGWSTDPTGRNNLIPIAVGILTLALSPYRPPHELAVGTGISTTLVGAIALLHAHISPSTVLPWIHVITWTAPVLALSLGATVFGYGMVREFDRWRREVASKTIETAPVLRQEIRREVQRNRVSILNQDVVPLFARVLERGDITETDRAEAAAIAAAIRGVMVAEVDRNWLESGVARFLPGGVSEDHPVVDPDRLSSLMSVDERAALRALLLAMFTAPSFDPRGFRIHFVGEPRKVRATVHAHLDHRERATRSILDPYLAVMRVMFPGLTLKTSPSAIRLEFSYGRS
ncbi:hypothetical protein ACFFGH_29345 [Lysobacter korlensis]|uniref:Transmembrane protein n=1 Tax=Lysobacter korlensis TaxID=553636 RepID=A0ABV6S1F0_9GAMM